MTFFRDLRDINNKDPEVFALRHRTSPGQSVWTRCGQEVRTVQRANNAAGPKAELLECARCWKAENQNPRTQEEAARELEGLLAQVSTLELPHPGALWKITLRTVHPGRWLVTYDDASCPMVFSPDGTEWEAAGEVVMECREACEAVTLPLPEAVALAERLLADGGPIYPLGDPLREQMRARN